MRLYEIEYAVGGSCGCFIIFLLSLRKDLDRVHVKEQKVKEMGLPDCGMAHRSSHFSGPDTNDPQSTIPPPLWKDSHLAIVGGELSRGNQIWLDGKDTCWDNGPCMLWGTLALSFGDKGVQYLLAHCP